MSHPNISKPGKWNTTVLQGSTFTRNLTIEGIDLSEYDFRGQIRKTYGSPVLASFTFALTSNSSFEVSLSAAQTSALPAGEAIFDIEIFTEDDAFVARIIEGKVKVSPEVTR